MVEEDWRANRLGIPEKIFLGGGVDERAGRVRRDLPGQRQDVVGALDCPCQKRDAEARALPRFSESPPLRQERFLIGVIGSELLTNAVCRMRVERLLTLVDLKRDVEGLAAARE